MDSDILSYDFISIDFETATASRSSACAVGIVAVKDYKPVADYYSILKPPDNIYSKRNINVHGITPEMSENSPSLSEVWPDICKFFSPHIPIVAHNARFDMSVLRNSIDDNIYVPDFSFFDTMDTSHYFCLDGHGLLDCAIGLGIDKKEDSHHNALSDAHVCAQIVIQSLKRLECLSVWEMLAKYPMYRLSRFSDVERNEQYAESVSNSRHWFNKPPKPSDLAPSTDNIDESHPLYGKNIVFTGELSISRGDAMQLAIDVGAVIKTSVSRKTNYIVVGAQDIDLVGSDGMSTKEEKAHELNSLGTANIIFLNEQEFLQLLHNEKVCE